MFDGALLTEVAGVGGEPTGCFYQMFTFGVAVRTLRQVREHGFQFLHHVQRDLHLADNLVKDLVSGFHCVLA